MRITTLYRVCLLLLLSMLAAMQGRASHYMGVDITYICNPTGGTSAPATCTYRIYHKTYYDCDGSATAPLPGPPGDPGTLTFIASGGGSCPQPTSPGGWQFVSYQEVTPVCPGTQTKCTSSSATVNGVLEAVYYRDYNFCNSANNPNCSFRIEWSTCCRNGAITGITNPSGAGIATSQTTIRPGLQPCNSSPQFLFPPVPYICAGQCFTFSQGAYDPDGDSLVYTLGTCLDGIGQNVTYAGGYTAAQPMGSSWNVTIDATNGDVTICPKPTGNVVVGIMCIDVLEYRNGTLIGRVRRDMQITVIPGCTSNPPNTGHPGFNGTTYSDTTTVRGSNTDSLTIGGTEALPLSKKAIRTCIGTPLKFTIPVTDAAPGKVYTMSWNGPGSMLPPYPTNFPTWLTMKNPNGAPPPVSAPSGQAPVAVFEGTPTQYGTYVFVLTVKDNSCPISRFLQYSVTIFVEDPLRNTVVDWTPIGCNLVSMQVKPKSTIPSPYSAYSTNLDSVSWVGTGNLQFKYNQDVYKDSLSHYYPAPGTYSYTVSIIDTFGCKLDVTQVGLLNTGATADAGADVTICAGYNYTMGGPMPQNQIFQWSPGTYLSSQTVSNPLLTAPTTVPNGTVAYTLTATQGVCTTYDYAEVTTVSNIVVNVTPVNAQVCPGDSVTLTAAGATSFLWDDGVTTTATRKVAPTQTTSYSAVGFTSGCTSLPAATTVTVIPGPVAQIVGNFAVCSGTPTQLTAVGPPNTTYQWITPAGTTTGNVYNVPSVSAPSMVALVPANSIGCQGDTVYANLSAFPKPAPSFVNDTVCVGVPTKFSDATSVANGNVVGWDWRFSSLGKSTQQNPSFTFQAGGTYTIRLRSVTDKGCVDSVVRTIVVKNNPVVDFGITNVCFGTQNILTSKSTLIPTLPGEAIATTAWTLGDGTTANTATVNHQYPKPGAYTATLQVTSNTGCTASKTQTLLVYPLPVSNFTFKPNCEKDSVVRFNLTSTVFGPGTVNNIVGANWDFGAPAFPPNTSTLFSPTNRYLAPGVYNVKLTSTTNNGCTDDTTIAITVYPKPNADFTVADRCENVKTTFTDKSTVLPSTPIKNWMWDLGNGVKSTNQNTGTQYMQARNASYAGTYNVTLIVRTNRGCTDTMTKAVNIFGSPRVNFSSTKVCLNDVTNFNNLTTLDEMFNNTSKAWGWRFGDNVGTAADSLTQYIYKKDGTFTAHLTVTTDSGCVDSFRQQVVVHPLPMNPQITEATACFGTSALLVANANPDIKVRWFATAKDSTPFHVDYSYVTPEVVYPQQYYVQTMTDKGCKSSRFPIMAKVFTDADASINATPDTKDLPLGVIAFNVDVIAPNSAQAATWRFGDGSTSKELTPTHEYINDGIYTVEADVTDKEGCVVTVQRQVEIRKVVNIDTPSAFSPNGDNTNDEYFINFRNITQMNFRVFNRWGQLVYETSDLNFRWNGQTAKGSAPEGVYVYELETVDIEGLKTQKKGTITIIR